MALAEFVMWASGLLLVAAIGFFGFFVMAAVLLFRGCGYVFRLLTGNGPARDRPIAQRRIGEHDFVCPHPRCGRRNERTARFCGRCGRPLRRTDDVDAYG